MGQTDTSHRPLLAGIKVNEGTLTGAARRLDGRKVVVTNLHIASGDRLSPMKGESLNQGGAGVGSLDGWVEIDQF